MTVQTNTNSIAYIGNGSTVHYDYDFLILDDAHLKVYFGDVLQVSGYVVSGVGSQSGGTVAFAVAPPNLTNITLTRDVPFLQLTDYQPYDAFPADSHERALDLLTMMAQQLKDASDRSLQYPVGGNKWDAKGNEIINVGAGSSDSSAPNIGQVKSLIASLAGPDSAAQLRLDLEEDGGSIVHYTPDTVPSLSPISIQLALRNRRNITDLGAVSGVANVLVDGLVIGAIAAGYSISLPDGFDYKTAGTLNMPSLKRVIMVCPGGRAKISASVAGLMFSSINTFKFDGSYFKNIDFVGAGKQNTASQWMYAEEGKYTANFITEDCSWDGFHTISKAACIGVNHYRPHYYGVGDTGAIVDTYHWTTSLFSSCNLNNWHTPRFTGKFGRLFKILGGFSNYIFTPWFEKVETVSAEMILMRQHYNMQIIGGWLENFKTKFLFNLDGDGTENTQSDICVIDGLHLNNNWASDPAHSGQASGFVALFNRVAPANSGNQYDTKFAFRNIMEHPDSAVGWALTRTGSTLNLATSIHEFVGCRLKTGHPDASDGMTLAGGTPDLRRHFRDLSSNKLDLTPGNYQFISGRNTTGSQKDIIFDNVNDLTYARRNGVQIIQWKPAYFAPGVTNTTTCGATTFAWSGGFTQTAFTVTSDENHKTPAQAIMDTLLDAWAEVQFVTYQFLDRVEMKGPDGARWHFGVVAQRVVEALERHGLIWGDYAFICFDKWDASPATYDDDGNMMSEAVEAGEKFGIRYEEALVLEAALQRRNYQRLLVRVEALEAK